MFWNMQARVDESVLTSTDDVTISASPGQTAFVPSADTMGTGLVFYPGALVDPDAYAPMARAVAEAGYPAVIVETPYRLAPFERHRADLFGRTRALIEADSVGRVWVVGGHSKGGKLAALFARENASLLGGLMLVGTSHPRRHDLSALRLDVTKVFGSEDGLASEAEVRQFAPNLPPSTHWERVEGGNHRQFGSYGWQLGDGEARISRDEQQRRLRDAALRQLDRVRVRR
jgi:dienelactone hydrolase